VATVHVKHSDLRGIKTKSGLLRDNGRRGASSGLIRGTAMSVDTNSAVPAGGTEFALFNLGFRPFFLLAALFAASSLPVWAAQYFGVLPAVGHVAGVAWHAHEMVYGFAIAVVTGFLFTAARNWTGLPTPTGRLLAALAAFWVLGRVAMLTGPGWLAAIVDVAFLPAVAGCLWKPLQQTRNRNRFFVGILLALAGVNGVFHGAHLGGIDMAPLLIMGMALGLVVMIVAIMAGRVVPAFTKNALRSARIRQVPGLDAIALVSLALALVAWIAAWPAWLLVPMATLAAGANAVRLWSWDPWSTRSQPILWILHLSYAWIPIGLLVLALAVAGVAGSTALAVHAWGAGAVGGMIIGMITRTALGHTGRPLSVGRAEVIAYCLVHLGAIARVFVPLVWPPAYGAALVAAAALWSVAFGIYCVVYWPLLSRVRADGKPG